MNAAKLNPNFTQNVYPQTPLSIRTTLATSAPCPPTFTRPILLCSHPTHLHPLSQPGVVSHCPAHLCRHPAHLCRHPAHLLPHPTQPHPPLPHTLTSTPPHLHSPLLSPHHQSPRACSDTFSIIRGPPGVCEEESPHLLRRNISADKHRAFHPEKINIDLWLDGWVWGELRQVRPGLRWVQRALRPPADSGFGWGPCTILTELDPRGMEVRFASLSHFCVKKQANKGAFDANDRFVHPQFTPGALAHTHDVTHALYVGQNLRFLMCCGFSGCASRMPVQTWCVTSCVSA